MGSFISLYIGENTYYYDTASNKIIKIPLKFKELLSEYITTGYNLFDENCNVDKNTLDEYKAWLATMIKKGIFSKNPVTTIKHQLFDLCESYIENDLKSLLLQVTQNCNLLCRYCGYAGYGVLDRQHSNSNMSFDTAKKAIDFSFANLKTKRKLVVSFYGGEPCANFQLIQQCVDYINAKYYACAQYNMTTNFTLVNDDMLTFFVKNNFLLTISIDGPREITNAMRRYRYNGNGVFDTVYTNLSKLKRLYPEFYANNVSFNAVIDPKYNYETIFDFFANDEVMKSNQVDFGIIDDSKNDYILDYSDEYILTYREKTLRDYINNLTYGTMKTNNSPDLFSDYFFNRSITDSKRLSSCFHHSGPCVAGCTRLFVDINGQLFPCEKASGLSKALIIGNVDEGINVDKVRSCLNLGSLSGDRCRNCWAMRLCSICAVNCDDIASDKLSVEAKHKCCIYQKERAMQNLKNKCLLIDCQDIYKQMVDKEVKNGNKY